MSLAFVLLGVALAAAAHGARLWVFARAPLVATLLSLAAAGSLVVSVFPLPDDPPMATNIMHQSGGAVLFAASAVAMWLVPASVTGRGWSLVAQLIMIFALVLGTAIVFRLPIIGLLQRLLLAAMCTWLVGAPRVAVNRPARPSL